MRDPLIQVLKFRRDSTATVLGILGLLALLLAVSGLGGVIAYWVSQRTREIGVRLALGAQQSDVLQLVVKQGMKVTFVGMFIGLGLAFGLTHFLSSLLYGIGADDPLTFVGVSILLVGVALRYE